MNVRPSALQHLQPRDANILRAVYFERPAFVPVELCINQTSWHHYPADILEDYIAEHPQVFRGNNCIFPKDEADHPPWQRAGTRFVDSWGCTWESRTNGMTGYVVKNALKDWAELATFRFPDPVVRNGWRPVNWRSEAARLAEARNNHRLPRASLRRGHTFTTLMAMRGYVNLSFDMADNDPNLHRLIGEVAAFNRRLVEQYVELGAQWIDVPDDLGTQTGPFLSPKYFRQFFKEAYEHIIGPAVDAACTVRLRSYGDVRQLVPDLLDLEIRVLGVQDEVNGLEWLARHVKDRLCLDVELDRRVLIYGNPDDVNRHIYGVFKHLGSRLGGLMIHHELMPGIPLKNVKAMLDALENYMGMYA